MKKRALIVLGIIMCFMWVTIKSALSTPLVMADQIYAGHEYRVIVDSIQWQDAKNNAQSIGWHLATITSQAEQNFIESLIQTAENNYQQNCNKSICGLWLGGFTSNNTWSWVTGENWSYTNWGSGQPSNGSYLAIAGNCSGCCCGGGSHCGGSSHCCNGLNLGDWYTLTNCSCNCGGCNCCCNICGYIEESSTPVPEPTTMFLLGAGILGVWGCQRKYKND